MRSAPPMSTIRANRIQGQAAACAQRCLISSNVLRRAEPFSGPQAATAVSAFHTTSGHDKQPAGQAQGRRKVLQLGAAAVLAGPGLLQAALDPRRAVAEPVVAVSQPLVLPASSVQRTDLAPGLNISRVVKGCWQLSGGHRGDRQSDRTAGQAVIDDFDAFAQAGITSWDCADHYGPAEVLIGRYLREHPEQQTNVQVLTKYCVFSGTDMATISRDAVEKAVDLSRSRLGVDSVDLMQYYWGSYDVNRYVDGALYLAELRGSGKLKHIGVTNFDVPRIEAMVKAGVPIAANQLQYSLLDVRPENGMSQFCAANGIQLLPYGVLAGGFLSDKYLGVPASKVSVDTYSKGKYSRVIGENGGWDWLQRLLQVLDSVARKHQVSISNVAARWVLQRPGVAAVILGARNASHIPDHQRLFTFQLDDNDLAAIKAVQDTAKRPRSDCYSWERGGEW